VLNSKNRQNGRHGRLRFRLPNWHSPAPHTQLLAKRKKLDPPPQFVRLRYAADQLQFLNRLAVLIHVEG
jgi:hypothetical protein